MTKPRTIFALILMLTSATALLPAQALSTASGGGGNQVSIGAGMVGAAFEGLSIDAGTVIEKYLYLGVGWSLGSGTLGGAALRQTVLRGVLGLPVFSQDEQMPISFMLTGVYEKIDSASDYLDEAELIRTGTGYEAAADVYRDFAVAKSLSLRTGLSGVYQAGVLITESIIGAAAATSPLQERYSRYFYGVKIGALYSLAERLVLGASLNGHLDGDFGIHYGFLFSISAPK